MIETSAFDGVGFGPFSRVQRPERRDVASILDACEEGDGRFDPWRCRRDYPGGGGAVVSRAQPELLEYENGDWVVGRHIVNTDRRSSTPHDFAVICRHDRFVILWHRKRRTIGLVPKDIPRPIDPVAVRTAEQQMLTPPNEKRMRTLLEALCDPARITIVRALRDPTLAASDLAHVIGRNRAATSQHLRVLREVGAIVAKRKGNVVRYTLSGDLPGSIIEDAASVFDQLQPATAPASG